MAAGGGEYLQHAAVYLGAAAVSVPICSRLGLGSVLGYLLAGVAVGPTVLNLVGDTEEIMHVAEFGVVVMLFLVGLELKPSMLWKLRGPVFGLGGLQVVFSTIAIAGCCLAMGLDWRAALALGLSLALSSTAIVLQSLAERGLQQTEGGQASFSVLLFQDIAVIPILALLPLLASGGHDDAHEVKGFAALPLWAQGTISLAVIAGIIFGSRYILKPVFRFIASTGIRELFTVTALFVVVGIAVLMGLIEISAALGTFIGGVVLADSEYRHELESDLEPFKGLLLGLFFITVGAGIDFALLANEPVKVFALVLLLMAGKVAIIYLLGTLWRVSKPHRWTMSLGLGQGGEFAFVLLAVIAANSLLSTDIIRLVTLVVALSMALTPLVFLLNDRVIQPRFKGSGGEREADDVSGGHGKPVVIAGFGRFGQLAGRMLKANGFEASILDLNPDSIATLRQHGLEVYYGNAMRYDLLETAGCGAARVLVVAVDDAEVGLEIVELARRHYPNLKIVARAKDARIAFAMRQAGVTQTVCEAEAGGLGLGEAALQALGYGRWRAARASRNFKRHQAETHRMLEERWGDEKAILDIHRTRVSDLGQLLDSDDANESLHVDRAWRTVRRGLEDDEHAEAAGAVPA